MTVQALLPPDLLIRVRDLRDAELQKQAYQRNYSAAYSVINNWVKDKVDPDIETGV